MSTKSSNSLQVEDIVLCIGIVNRKGRRGLEGRVTCPNMFFSLSRDNEGAQNHEGKRKYMADDHK